MIESYVFLSKQVGWRICNFIIPCKVEGQVLEESPMVLSPYKIKEYIIQKYIMRRPLPSGVIWDIYGPYMGTIWDNLWALYGFHMVLIWDITHHIKPV